MDGTSGDEAQYGPDGSAGRLQVAKLSMCMRFRRLALSLLFTCIALSQIAAQETSHTASEQASFSAEDSAVKRPVEIPEDGMAILRRDDFVASVLRDQEITPAKLPQSWFSASSIHLGLNSRPDLVVVGEPPLAGANVVMFWIFRSTPAGHKLLFRAGGHDLVVLNSRHNGLRDVQTSSVTLQRLNDSIYRYNGSRYVVYRDRSKSIP